MPGPSAPGPSAPAPPGLDLPAVTLWMRERGLASGELTAQLVAGGRSNLTYVLSAPGDDSGAGHRLVLRRPPLGHVLATAHDMAREHRVLSALHGTAVPVPEPLALCDDDAVTGAPFYVMEFADGVVVRTRDDVAQVPADRREPLLRTMTDVLADLHAVD